MDFNSALDIIVKDLGEAAKIIDDLKNYSGVPAFQVELAKAKCRSAAEIIVLLKEIPVNQEPVKESDEHMTPVASERIYAPVESPGPVLEAAKASGSNEIPEATEKIQPGSGPDTLDFLAEAENEPATMEDVPVPPKNETGKGVTEKTVDSKDKRGGPGIFADRFKEVPGRVNERMQALRPEEDLTSRLKQSPITNLADAIGVNDRFYFIREVFGGNNNNYREAIERLNSVSKVNEAVEIIHGYTGEETNQEAVSNLLALVKRKTGFDE